MVDTSLLVQLAMDGNKISSTTSTSHQEEQHITGAIPTLLYTEDVKRGLDYYKKKLTRTEKVEDVK